MWEMEKIVFIVLLLILFLICFFTKDRLINLSQTLMLMGVISIVISWNMTAGIRTFVLCLYALCGVILLLEIFGSYHFYHLQGKLFYHDKEGFDDYSSLFIKVKKEHGYEPASIVFYPSGIVKLDKKHHLELAQAIEKMLRKDDLVPFPYMNYLLGTFYLWLFIKFSMEAFL